MKLRRLSGNRRHGRDGAAAAEFAIVLPFLALLLLGTLETARFTSVSELLTNVARDGCRVAVMNGNTNDTATTRMTTMLRYAGITGYTITIEPDVQTSSLGDPITVTITIPYSKVSWFPAYILSPSLTISGTAIMSSEHMPIY
jgi:Flp pilus assembly protein TadG